MGMGGGGSSGTQLTGAQAVVGSNIMNFLLGRTKQQERNFPGTRVGKGATPYEGDRVAPLSQEALQARELLQGYTGNEFQAGTTGAIDRALSGEAVGQLDPESTSGFFRKAVTNPLLREFDLNIRPRLRAGFAEQGALFSSARGNAEGRALEGLQTTLASGLGQAQIQNQQINAALQESAAARSLQAVPVANQQGMEPLRRAAGLLQIGAPFQAQEQLKLDTAFNEFQRLAPENDPFVAQAQQFFSGQGPLGYKNEKTSAGALGAGVGAAAGGLLLTGAGATAATALAPATGGLSLLAAAGLGAAAGGGIGSAFNL